MPPQVATNPKTSCPHGVVVFTSYASVDEVLLADLRAHRSALEREGLVCAWDDRQIGEDSVDEIDARLNGNAANSAWVRWEYQTALSAKKRDTILPMPLEDPSLAPPPPELADVHMRDRFMLAGYGMERVREAAKTMR
jgi:hypothetical protein